MDNSSAALSVALAADMRAIRNLVDGWVKAVRDGDVDARLADYAPDILSFDAVNPMQLRGIAALAQRLEAWLGSYRGPIDYAVRDVAITASDSVAFMHCLSHVKGTLKAGGKVDMWVRSTACLQKRDGRWLVVHEHTSSPFDPQTGQASTTLQP